MWSQFPSCERDALKPFRGQRLILSRLVPTSLSHRLLSVVQGVGDKPPVGRIAAPSEFRVGQSGNRHWLRTRGVRGLGGRTGAEHHRDDGGETCGSNQKYAASPPERPGVSASLPNPSPDTAGAAVPASERICSPSVVVAATVPIRSVVARRPLADFTHRDGQPVATLRNGLDVGTLAWAGTFLKEKMFWAWWILQRPSRTRRRHQPFFSTTCPAFSVNDQRFERLRCKQHRRPSHTDGIPPARAGTGRIRTQSCLGIHKEVATEMT